MKGRSEKPCSYSGVFLQLKRLLIRSLFRMTSILPNPTRFYTTFKYEIRMSNGKKRKERPDTVFPHNERILLLYKLFTLTFFHTLHNYKREFIYSTKIFTTSMSRCRDSCDTRSTYCIKKKRLSFLSINILFYSVEFIYVLLEIRPFEKTVTNYLQYDLDNKRFKVNLTNLSRSFYT